MRNALLLTLITMVAVACGKTETSTIDLTQPAEPAVETVDDTAEPATDSAEMPQQGAAGEVPAETADADSVENPAPAFTLPGVDGKEHSLADYAGKTVVLEWINHGCPYVKKHYSVGNMQKLQKQYTEAGVVWLAICSSAPGKQGHMDVDSWKKKNTENGTTATVLLDPDGTVGRAYGARVTPHMFVIDGRGGIVYEGAIDDNPAKSSDVIATATNHVAATLDALLAGEAAPVATTQPYG